MDMQPIAVAINDPTRTAPLREQRTTEVGPQRLYSTVSSAYMPSS